MFCFVGDGTSVMGKSRRKDFNFWDILDARELFCLFVLLIMPKYSFFFFFPVGKLLCSRNQSQGLVLSREENLPM